MANKKSSLKDEALFVEAMADKGKKRCLPFSVAAMVFLAFFFLCFRGSIHVAQGLGDSPTSNVAGWAWSSNFKWISFNCFNNNSCASSGGIDYGVNINTAADGNQFNLGGHAWSSNVGWISFRYDALPPPDNYKFSTNCKGGFTCNAANNCTACYNPDNGKIFGWARVMNLGSDGWIYLNATTTSPGVSIDQTSASGTFSGFGWNGNTYASKGLGWLSFNCSDLGTCGAVNYFVYLKGHHLPDPKNLRAPNWPIISACSMKLAVNASLQWSNIGYTSIAYQVVLNTSNSTSAPPSYSTFRRNTPGVSSFIVSSTNALMGYDRTLYWWVRVWDDFGFVSLWRQFNTSTPGDVLTDNVARNIFKGNSRTFTTYLHEMPITNFSYYPLDPIAYMPVTTTDASFYFTDLSPNIPTACDKTHCAWYWWGDKNVSNSATTSTSTVMTFVFTHNAKINLRITNIPTSTYDTYNCVSSTPAFFVDLLPMWKERKSSSSP
jgi:hypothetical protein